MTEGFWLAIVGLSITAVVAPVLLHLLTSAAKRREREEDREERRSIARELRDVGTKIDGMLVDRDKAKVAEGEAKGEAKAAVLAEGQRQGAESARIAVAADKEKPV